MKTFVAIRHKMIPNARTEIFAFSNEYRMREFVSILDKAFPEFEYLIGKDLHKKLERIIKAAKQKKAGA